MLLFSKVQISNHKLSNFCWEFLFKSSWATWRYMKLSGIDWEYREMSRYFENIAWNYGGMQRHYRHTRKTKISSKFREYFWYFHPWLRLQFDIYRIFNGGLFFSVCTVYLSLSICSLAWRTTLSFHNPHHHHHHPHNPFV